MESIEHPKHDRMALSAARARLRAAGQRQREYSTLHICTVSTLAIRTTECLVEFLDQATSKSRPHTRSTAAPDPHAHQMWCEASNYKTCLANMIGAERLRAPEIRTIFCDRNSHRRYEFTILNRALLSTSVGEMFGCCSSIDATYF